MSENGETEVELEESEVAKFMDDGQQSLNRGQLREKITNLIEQSAISGIPAEDVSEILAERGDATEYLYEGMMRYGQNPEPDGQEES